MKEIADRPGPRSSVRVSARITTRTAPEAEPAAERHRKPTSWLKILSGVALVATTKMKEPSTEKRPESVYMYKKMASRTPRVAVAGGCTTTTILSTLYTHTQGPALPSHAHRAAQHVKYIHPTRQHAPRPFTRPWSKHM